MTYHCPHCGSEGRIQVQAVISAPAALAHQFSKQNLRRADVHLMGVLWETMDFICGSEKCGRVTDGYGNYVTNLAKRVKELEAQVAQAPSMTDAMRAFIEGMSVSVDVSTCEADAGHRYFGTVIEVMDDEADKHGVTLLVQDAKPNF
ncbi:hypothetical protein C0Q88_07510 [Ralstonia pickettii]|uniref:Uncharacterized protein n=1 Tax=Ralstonia pickettii TaxID=329 RepID=A0A2N4TXU3_RALPI|nr:hypothetical protein [Ralstonia pickettii]PLC44517.1 hypothetical protein C0Q88_07510 [Ralstonia pickettii]